MPRGRGRREYPQVPIDFGAIVSAIVKTRQAKKAPGESAAFDANQQSIADAKLGDAFFRSGGQQEQLTGSAEGFITREQAGSIIRNSPELAKALQNQVERGSLGNIVNNAEALKRLSDAFIGQQEAQASTSLNTYNFGTGEFLVPGSPGGLTTGPDGKLVDKPATLPRSIPKAPKLGSIGDFQNFIGASGNLAPEGRARVSAAPSIDPSLIDPAATFKVPDTINTLPVPSPVNTSPFFAPTTGTQNLFSGSLLSAPPPSLPTPPPAITPVPGFSPVNVSPNISNIPISPVPLPQATNFPASGISPEQLRQIMLLIQQGRK